MADAAVTVIGGGVVGLAIAAELSPLFAPVVLLERRHSCGQETSSRNSEVIHAGIYYPHGSLKARLCVEGNRRLSEICTRNHLPHRTIGKIITAVSKEELPELERLYRHGVDNGVPLQMLSAGEVGTLEPHIATEGGILSSSTGIISAHALVNFFARKATENGCIIRTRAEVVGIDQRGSGYQVTFRDVKEFDNLTTRFVVNAAGLEADRVAALAGVDTKKAGYELHWTKGTYFAVSGPKKKLVSRLIYPLPPRDSLGVHAVVDLAGGLRFGPDVEPLQDRILDYDVMESKRAVFGNAVRRIIPSINDEDLSPDQSGIRPRLKGDVLRDFVIVHEKERGLEGLINLIGIESPGLTSSPAIATHVRNMIEL